MITVTWYSAVGYNSNLQEQTTETLKGIHSLGTLVPSIALGAVFLMIVFVYPLNKKRTSQLAIDLAERRIATE